MKIYKLHRNSDFKNQPAGSSKLIVNCNINYEFGSLTTEDGFDLVIEYPYGYLEDTTSTFNDKVLIGHILLPDNSLCLISQIADYQDGIYAEVAILKNSSYRPILRAQLNLSDKFPIEGAAKLNGKGETLIYFTDYKNPQRWLNLTNPQVAINSNLFVTGDLDELLYFPKYNNSKVNLIAVETGGNLPCGAYIPVYKYSDEFYNETDVSYNSHVISLGDGAVLGNTQYDGGIVNSNSNKSITLELATPDPKYTFVHLYLVYKAASSYVVYDCGFKNINNRITVSSLTGLTTVPLETVTVKRANYTTAKTVTQLDSVLYWGNLKGREDFDFQPYVNNIVIAPHANDKSLTVTDKVDFRNELTIYNERGFLHDEVYAFYASFFIEDEKGSYETKAYHIPGRQARTVIYGGTAAVPVITGGLQITDSNGRVTNLDETESLDSVQVNYRLNQGTGFSSLNTNVINGNGTLTFSTNITLEYDIDTISYDPSSLTIGTVALLKQYVNATTSGAYYYVQINSVSSTTSGAITTYTHDVTLIRSSSNAPTTGIINLLGLSSVGFPPYGGLNGISNVAVIANDYISNGALNTTTNLMVINNTDPSPAGQMYTVNNGAKVFHAFPTGQGFSGSSAMGFWENQNENYSNTDNWLIKDAFGDLPEPPLPNNIKGQKVRHHKFPHASKNNGFQLHINSTDSDTTPTAITSANYEQINILGINLTSIVIPNELSTKVKKVNIYYAKQGVADKLIVGQSIALHDNKIDDYDPSRWSFLYPIAAHSAGNIKLTNIVAGRSGSATIFDFSPDRKFIRCSPFDNVSSDTISNVTHINVLYKLNTSYNQVYTNNIYTQPLNLGMTSKSNEIDYQWRMDNKTIANTFCVQTSYDIFNRAIKKYNYIDSVPLQAESATTPGGDPYPVIGNANNYLYGTSKSIWHYRSDKTVLSELYIDLNSTVNTNTIQAPAEYIKTESSFTFGTPDAAGNIKYGDAYLVNLCAFKEDLFQNFETKELAFAGSFDTNVVYFGLFGGDTFTNYYGYRSTTDLAALFNEGLGFDEKIDLYIMKFLHYFICQSISNINYRNNGTSDQDTYFPYAINDVVGFLKSPLIPNGQANFYSYNKAYNTVNDINQPQIGEMFKMEMNVDTFPTRIIRSAKDNVQSIYDNYRVVLANDYTDLPKDRGQIWAIKGAFNKLNIFFENTFRETMGRERLLTQSAEAYIGAGDIFAVPPRELTSADGGYAGSMSQWAINVTPYGLFFVDVNRGRVFLKTESLDEISLPDMFYFFQDQSKFTFRESLFNMIDNSNLYISWYPGYSADINKLVKYNNAYYQSLSNANTTIPTNTTNWTLVFNIEDVELLGMDSVYQGFRSAFDPEYKRIILSRFNVTVKNSIFFGGIIPVLPDSGSWSSYYDDNKVYFVNNELQKYDETNNVFIPLKFTDTTYFTTDYWTIAYYPEYKGWGSFYTYYPDRIFSSNDSVYSTKRLDNDNDPYTKLYEHNKQVLPYFYNRTQPEPSTIDAIFNPMPEQIKEFKSIQFKTKANKYIGNKQSQEYLTTFDTYQAYDSYQLAKEVTLQNTVSARNLEGYWSINDFRDWFTNGLHIFENIKDWALNFNLFGINVFKHWNNLKRFVDNWFAVRLKYNNFKFVNLLTGNPVPEIVLRQVDTNEQIKLFVKMTLIPNSTLDIGDVVKVQWSNSFEDHTGRIYDITTGTGVTINAINVTSNVITVTGSTLTNGDVLIFTNSGTYSGFALNTRYFIVNKSGDDFQLSTTSDGTNILNINGIPGTFPTTTKLGSYFIELYDYKNLGSSVISLQNVYQIIEVKLSLLETVATYIKNTR